MCLSPLLCNLAVCLHGSAGLSDPCVYKLAGYRHSGQIHHPEFSFPYVLALKYFPVAARVLDICWPVLLWDPVLKSLKALAEQVLWDLVLSVSVLSFFVLSFENMDGDCDKLGVLL